MTTATTIPLGSLKRAARNAASMLTSDVLNRGTTFIVYVFVGRYLGAHSFGQLSLALALSYTFFVFTMVGLRTFVTREVARDTASTDKYFINGSLVVTASSLISILTMTLFVRLMDYSADTSRMILLMSLGLLPQALSTVCESVLRSWERMHYIAYANVSVNLAKVGLAYLLLSRGYGLASLIIMLLLCRVAIMVFQWYFLVRYVWRPRGAPSLAISVQMVRNAVTFLGIDGMLSIWASLNIVVLSKLASETEVGLYNAAAQLVVPIGLVYKNVMASVFPAMCRKYDSSFEELGYVSQKVLEFLSLIAVPAAVGLFLIAEPLLLWVYGQEDFVQTSQVLRILAWGLILNALTQGLGHILLASHREKVTLRIVAVDLVVGVCAALLLISQFGLIGAAIAALVFRAVDFVQHYVRVSQLLARISLSQAMWKAVVASAVMAISVTAVPGSGVVLPVLVGVLTYVVALLLLTFSTRRCAQLFGIAYPNQSLE